MKISIKNLDTIKQAEFTLGELTIICGDNNTGKTYTTYALFGFMSFWRDVFSIKVPDKDVQCLLNEGNIDLDLKVYVGKASTILKNGCRVFTEQLSHIFASPDNHFSDSHFAVDLDPNDIQPSPTFERTMGGGESATIFHCKKADSQLVTISLSG